MGIDHKLVFSPPGAVLFGGDEKKEGVKSKAKALKGPPCKHQAPKCQRGECSRACCGGSVKPKKDKESKGESKENGKERKKEKEGKAPEPENKAASPQREVKDEKKPEPASVDDASSTAAERAKPKLGSKEFPVCFCFCGRLT